MNRQISTDLVKTWTTAPSDFDYPGFGTVVLRELGDIDGKTVREVATPLRHLDHQRRRYYSGAIYLVAESETEAGQAGVAL